MDVSAEPWIYSGWTDALILTELLAKQGWSKKRIEAQMPSLKQQLEKSFHEYFRVSEFKVLPGVTELLVALDRPGTTLGLITGNLEPIARAKLQSLGLWRYFDVGGFGSDPHRARKDLVSIAIARAGSSTSECWVIGDTPNDIRAAHEAGVKRTMGVATGSSYSAEDLNHAGATVVFDDLRDTSAVLKALS